MTMNHRFKQFFTPKKYSQVMINELVGKKPKKIIDLAIGRGSLLHEAMTIWNDAEYYGNDIDQNCCEVIFSKHPQIECYNKDIFLKSSINELVTEIGQVDLCLGNPPFDLIKQDNDIKEILRDYKLDKKYNSEYIPAEVIFILQCLNILSINGTLSLILPDGFFTNCYLECFRKFLLEKYKIINIIELPKNIFKKTDAKTHILTLEKTNQINNYITLSSVDNRKTLKITKERAIVRMDYSYYNSLFEYKEYQPISNLDILFMRGRSKYLIEGIQDNHILHTTNFSKTNKFTNRLRTMTQLSKYPNKIAIPGDIVIARVGSYSLGKIGIIEKGFFIATDCVFILRVKDKGTRIKLFNSLQSKSGQKWIFANSKGVAAKHITLEDIKKFPIIKE